MIKRDFEAAARREFDLLVVGGGIYGVSLLQEAARRGLSACLCEAGDFGGGTSWNSLRIVHGGLRYLQTLDLRRFFQSVAARRRVARQFPSLVRPMACVMPLYGQGMKRPSVMGPALLGNDILSARRNAHVVEAARLPASGVLDREATLRAFPRARTDGLQGAARWSDYLMVSSERIVVELLRDACRNGAVALNYAPVLDVVSDGNVTRGVRVRDEVLGTVHTISAGAVVNCAGQQVRTLASGRGGKTDELFRPSLAFNLLLDLHLGTNCAVAVSAPEPGAPVLFLLPQDGILMAGTMHRPRPADTTVAKPTEAEIVQFLRLLNEAIPGLGAGLERVKRVFAGLLPVTAVGGTDLAKRELLLDHGAQSGLQRLYSVSGVKFTTAGDVARQLLAMVGAGGRRPHDEEPLDLSPDTGLLVDAARLWTKEPAEARAALVRVIAEEAVQDLDDLVLRRANWVATGCNVDRVAARVLELTGGDLPGRCVMGERNHRI